MKTTKVNLNFFAGKTLTLSGWDNCPISNDFHDEDANSVLFILDVTYQAIEDPNDGYKSRLKEIFISDLVCLKFNPHIVKAKYRIVQTSYYTNDVIDFYDIITKKNNYEYRYF